MKFKTKQKSRIKMNITFIFTCLVLIQLNGQSISKKVLKDSIRSIINEKEIPGVFVTVVSKDSVLFQEGIGYVDLEDKRPVNEKHLFRLGSISKTFTALAVMKLVKEGKLNLEDELREIAPEIPFENKWESTHPLKIKHLLEHKSGFDDLHLSMMPRLAKKPKGMTIYEEVLAFNSSYKCNWRPGLVTSYSNPGYVILGYIIEKLSGKSFKDYLHYGIFLPMGMTSSHYISELKKETPHSNGFVKIDKTVQNIPENQNFYGETSSGVLSNAEDMSKFLQYFLNTEIQDSIGIIGSKGIKEMEKLHSLFEIENKIKSGRSIGLTDKQFGTPELSFKAHNGLIDGFLSYFLYSREYDIGVAISGNLFGVSSRPIVDLIVNSYCVSNTAKYPLKEKVDLSKFKEWEGEHRQLNEENELFHLINFPIRTKNVKIENNTLVISEVLETPEVYFQIEENAFRSKQESLPTVYLTEFEGEKSIYYHGRTFVSTSEVVYSIFRTLLVFCLIVSIIGVLTQLILLVLWPFKKVSNQTFLRSLLILAPFILIVASFGIFFANYYSYAGLMDLGQPSTSSFLVFIMTSLFPIIFIWAATVLFKQWFSLKRWYAKLYYSCMAFSSFFITTYSICLGWFAIKLWTL